MIKLMGYYEKVIMRHSKKTFFMPSLPTNGWHVQTEHLTEDSGFKALEQFLADEVAQGKTVFPPDNLVFNAFRLTAYEKVRVVILGQDPYIRHGQACGLSFSVPHGVAIPPSLKNIYKELVDDIQGFEIPDHGNLENWADQGVLLLNSVLSVEEGISGSHAGKGWEKFTDGIIEILNQHPDRLVFLLWGGYAKKKGKLIDRQKHEVLESGHPSPLSVRYFRGCHHFSKVNALLKKQGKSSINWQV